MELISFENKGLEESYSKSPHLFFPFSLTYKKNTKFSPLLYFLASFHLLFIIFHKHNIEVFGAVRFQAKLPFGQVAYIYHHQTIFVPLLASVELYTIKSSIDRLMFIDSNHQLYICNYIPQIYHVCHIN